MAAALAVKVRMAFEELSLSGDGLVPWSRLEELFLKLEVKPKAIQLCRHLVDAEGLVDSAELFRWLYDGEDVSPYHEGRRLHERVPPCRWCISRCDFQDFVAEVVETHRAGRILNQPNPRTKEPNPFHDDEHVGPNMHAVNEAVIRPRTARAGGMSWALMLSPEGLSGEFFFVTHSWKEGVYEFSRKVLNHWQDEALSMWCCFLANPQTWQREDLNQLLGQSFDLMDSPFMQALSSQQLHSFVVVPNVTESLYCRLWCVAELWKAMEVQKLRGDGRMIQVAKDNVKDSHKVRPTEIATLIHGATCSDVNDEKRIRAYIAGKEQHIQEMIKDLAGMKKSKKTHHSLSHEQERRKTEEELRYREKERGRKEHQERHATSEVVVCPHPQMEERIVQSLGGEDLIIEEDQQREVVVERHARHPRRSAAPRAPSTSDVHEERRQQVLEDRIRQVRAQVEQQRLEETRVEHTLMTRVEDLERQLQHRRQSIVHRISREQEREENLRKYLRYLEDADLEDLCREIRLRKDSALLKEETLRQQLEHLLPSPPSPKGERGHREERLERQIALRRQLETLETSEGSDSVRRHLLALKQAEMMEFQREVQLHRMEDEAKELPMRQQLEELHEEWQRFRVQCEHERQAAEMQEEQILLEMSSLTDHRKRQEQDMSPDTSKERRSKSRQALGARSSSEGGKASGRGLELERRDPVPSSHWGSQELDLTPQHNVVGPPIHLEDGPGRHSGPPGGASRGRSDQEELDLTPQHNVVGPPIHLEDGPGRHSGPPGGASRGRSDQEDLSPQSARSGTDVTPVVSQSRSVVSGQESEDEADESDDDLLFI